VQHCLHLVRNNTEATPSVLSVKASSPPLPPHLSLSRTPSSSSTQAEQRGPTLPQPTSAPPLHGAEPSLLSPSASYVPSLLGSSASARRSSQSPSPAASEPPLPGSFSASECAALPHLPGYLSIDEGVVPPHLPPPTSGTPPLGLPTPMGSPQQTL
jgi:hypothetical protein